MGRRVQHGHTMGQLLLPDGRRRCLREIDISRSRV